MERDNRNQQAADALQELQLVKEMIQKTKQKVIDRGAFFLLWGGLVSLAGFSVFALTQLGRESLIWLPWVILLPIGMIASIFLSRKHSKESKYTSFVEQSYNSIWLACGLAFFIVTFVNSITSFLSPGAVYPIVLIISGIGVFASGGIMEWTSLRIGGLFLWGGAIAMMLSPVHYHALIMAVAIIPGYIIPGYVLKRQFGKSNPNVEA